MTKTKPNSLKWQAMTTAQDADYVPRNALPEERGTIYIYKKSINSIFLQDSLSSYDGNV
jgi:hypothetical protein